MRTADDSRDVVIVGGGPAGPGAELWGRSILNCPDCDGRELVERLGCAPNDAPL